MACKVCQCNPQDKDVCRIENSSDEPCSLETLLKSHEPQAGCTKLCLRACRINDIHIARDFPSLTSLDLSSNDITEIPDDFFSHVPNLKYCYFEGNRISNIPASIELIQNAEYVSFDSNLLRETSVPLASLLKLTYLKSFRVFDNFIDTAALVDAAPATVPPNLMSMVPFFTSYMLAGSWNQKTPSRITEHLFLGSVDTTENLEELRRLGITHVLSVGVPPVSTTVEEGFTTKFIMALDFPFVPLIDRFDEAVEFIDSAVREGKGCLVHCAMGVSRSATCVCAWLIKKRGMNAAEALEYVTKKRKCVSPNLGFIEQLYVYSKRFSK